MEVDDDNSSDKLSDSSGDGGFQEQQLGKVEELEGKVIENPFNYNAHVQLITTLHEIAELDKLRLARNRMAEHFPLSSTLWMEWLVDEIKIATTLDEKKQVEQLFERAVKDYLSVEVWLEFVQFSIGLQAESDDLGVENVRKVFERALAAAGLHVVKGALLWEAYIEFEVVVLAMLQEQGSKATVDAVESQLKRIANLFRRQLSCPLLDMDETYERFNMWLVDNAGSLDSKIIDRSLVEATYKKAKEKLRSIEKFEDNLMADTDCYRDYANHEKSKDGSPARVLCLYERALCDLCLHDTLWQEYIEYIDSVLQDGMLAMSVARRSIRNCPWSGQLASMLLRLMEKNGASHEDIIGAVEQALTPGLKQPADLRDVWMSYLEYMRRRFDAPDISKQDEEKRLQELRAAFTKALEHLNAVEGADPECIVAQFWARVEAKCAKDLEKARLLWSDIMAEPQHRTAVMWIEYINLEMAYGDSKHLRKLLPRALQQTTDWPESIFSVWINYERDEGTLESYMNCVTKCAARVAQVKKQRLDQEKKHQEANERYPPREDNRRAKRSGLGFQKPERTERKPERKPDAKKEAINPRKRQLEEKSAAESSPEKKKKASDDTGDIVDQLLNENNKVHGVSVKHDPSKDNRTVFISNLDYSTTEEPLREIFTPDGTITDLRLVKDFKGRSKGYCYVEFQKVEMAMKALKRDRQLIGGRPMFVSRCDPDKETRTTAFRFATSVEKNKLFVRGLPFTTTEAELRELFGQYGSVKDVRLVMFRNGHSKGLAYVDYHDEVSASQAILKADGMLLADKPISVAISNPPGRQKPDALPASAGVSSLGGGKKEAGPRGRGRTQISFLPRSVQLNPVATAGLEKLTLASPQPKDSTLK